MHQLLAASFRALSPSIRNYVHFICGPFWVLAFVLGGHLSYRVLACSLLPVPLDSMPETGPQGEESPRAWVELFQSIVADKREQVENF